MLYIAYCLFNKCVRKITPKIHKIVVEFIFRIWYNKSIETSFFEGLLKTFKLAEPEIHVSLFYS